MRWKLLRRRLSISAPRMIVRSHLPWPLRWVAVALVFGFSAALALWAFEFGKSIAGLDRDAKAELSLLRVEVAKLRDEREGAQSIANTAESLLKAEKVAQGHLKFQALIMQMGKNAPEFVGRYDIVLFGTLDNKPWTLPQAGGAKLLQVKQSARLEGIVSYPQEAVVKTVQIKVTDNQGGLKATQTVKL